MLEFLSGLDGNILLFIQDYIRQPWMDWFWKLVTTLGDVGFIWIVASVIMLFFKKTRKIAIVSLISLTICICINNVILKNIIDRARPFTVVEGLSILVKKPIDSSFPSGHTCASFAVATIYYKYFPKKIGIPCIIFAALIGFSRLYVGVHYPTDVLVGFLLGFLGALIVYGVGHKWIEGKVDIVEGKIFKKKPKKVNEDIEEIKDSKEEA